MRVYRVRACRTFVALVCGRLGFKETKRNIKVLVCIYLMQIGVKSRVLVMILGVIFFLLLEYDYEHSACSLVSTNRMLS